MAEAADLSPALQDAHTAPGRAAVERLQAAMREHPQLPLTTQHHFADGMYCRVLPRPAGAVIVGKVHKREHIYACLKGRVAVVNPADGSRRELQAGDVIVSQPGTKRAVVALEDSICMTVHRVPSGSTDLDEIEGELIEPDDTALFDARNELRRIAP